MIAADSLPFHHFRADCISNKFSIILIFSMLTQVVPRLSPSVSRHHCHRNSWGASIAAIKSDSFFGTDSNGRLRTRPTCVNEVNVHGHYRIEFTGSTKWRYKIREDAKCYWCTPITKGRLARDKSSGRGGGTLEAC